MVRPRIPELDGIRGIGIVAVLLLHVGAMRGGFLGVDVFFCLSGYLITSILLSEHERTGTVSLSRFYYRRALRLFPALAVLLIVIAAWGQVESLYVGVTNREAVTATSFYYANWLLLVRWQGEAPPLGPLSHAWSLSIEEQFYILWPLILLACLKLKLSKRWIGRTLLALACLSLLLRLLLYFKHAPWPRIYYGTDTHCDGLLIGCAIALLKPRLDRIRRYVPVLASWGMMLLCLILSVDTLMSYSGIFAASALTGMVIATLDGSSLKGALSSPTLVYLGQRSYSLYLWHYPVTAHLLPRFDLPLHLSAPLAVALSLTLAEISYRYVEQPFLRLKSKRVSTAPSGRSGTTLVERFEGP